MRLLFFGKHLKGQTFIARMKVRKIKHYPCGWVFFAVEVSTKDFEHFVAAARSELGSRLETRGLKKHVIDSKDGYCMYELGPLSFDYLGKQQFISAVLDAEKKPCKEFFFNLIRRMETMA